MARTTGPAVGLRTLRAPLMRVCKPAQSPMIVRLSAKELLPATRKQGAQILI